LRGAAAARRRSSLRPRLQPLRLLNLPRDPFHGARVGMERLVPRASKDPGASCKAPRAAG
jgi:hypothetical protein